MVASPATDPKTHQLNPNDTRSLWRRFNSDSLAALLQLPGFKLPSFARLEQSILGKLKARANLSELLLTQQSQCAMERFMAQHISRPLVQMHQENRVVITELQQQHKVHLREKEVMLQHLLKGDHIVVASPTGLVSVSSPSKAQKISNLAVVTPLTAVELTDSAEELTTLADGKTPRKRRCPITQHEAISREVKMRQATGVESEEELAIFNDQDCNCACDYWNKYNRKWKNMSRKDVGGKRGRSQWVTQRSGIWRLIEHCMFGLNDTEEAAIQKAELIYASVEVGSRSGKPNIKHLNKAFKAELSRLGISLTGRPKQAAKKNNPASSNFATDFEINKSQQVVLDRVRAEEEERRRTMLAAIEHQQQQQQNHNHQARWEHTHRYQQHVPPRPTNYDNIHPLPLHPIPGQPTTELPPGHQYWEFPKDR
jgi:hypothetical protein